MKILVTGGAGFIGSNLTEALLEESFVEEVVVLDNLETGNLNNLSPLKSNPKFRFVQADIRDYETCVAVSKGMDLISHQAALGSVPRSVADPKTSNDVNIGGTLNIFNAARENGIKRVVYAASSSTYGDHPGLPKVEDKIGSPLSPYAVTKLVNELYARVFTQIYGQESIGLRYFNVYGPRQNPRGPYAAVIPLFVKAFMDNASPVINGDGEHSRDFTFVKDVVQANKLALFTTNPEAVNQVYNIAKGERTSLNDMIAMLNEITGKNITAIHGPERKGDVKHSLASIEKAKSLLGYNPSTSLRQGLAVTNEWYNQNPLIFA